MVFFHYFIFIKLQVVGREGGGALTPTGSFNEVTENTRCFADCKRYLNSISNMFEEMKDIFRNQLSN